MFCHTIRRVEDGDSGGFESHSRPRRDGRIEYAAVSFSHLENCSWTDFIAFYLLMGDATHLTSVETDLVAAKVQHALSSDPSMMP
jgi:hypothetical protein